MIQQIWFQIDKILKKSSQKTKKEQNVVFKLT